MTTFFISLSWSCKPVEDLVKLSEAAGVEDLGRTFCNSPKEITNMNNYMQITVGLQRIMLTRHMSVVEL